MRAPVLAVAAVLLAAPLAASADCPSNTIALGGAPFPWSESALDSTLSSGGDVIERGAFDLSDGTLSIVHGGGLVATSVVARDLFDLTGAPPGTPIPVTVEFSASGIVSSPGC